MLSRATMRNIRQNLRVHLQSDRRSGCRRRAVSRSRCPAQPDGSGTRHVFQFRLGDRQRFAAASPAAVSTSGEQRGIRGVLSLRPSHAGRRNLRPMVHWMEIAAHGGLGAGTHAGRPHRSGCQTGEPAMTSSAHRAARPARTTDAAFRASRLAHAWRGGPTSAAMAIAKPHGGADALNSAPDRGNDCA